MRFRLSAWLLALIAACCSNWALALGLGEIKLNSALNQPLDAEIELLQVRDLTPQEISVSLANAEEFERLGIDRPFFLSELRFVVDLQAPAGPVVRVTSLKPVREPFLNFVVNAAWPSGRLLREYTLLVDLPVFTGARAQAPAVPARSEPRPTPRQAAPTPAATPAPAPATTRPAEPAADAAGADTYGPVGANDSLWAIASRVRPSRELSVQQTMLALQRMNPDAFINNNINLLRRGQVLRVPTAEEIEALTFQQAVRQVAEQNAAFQNRATAAEPAAAERPQLDASEPPRAEPEAAPAPEGRVKLSAPSDAAEGGSATGDGRNLSAMELELSQAQEQLDAASRESGELRNRINAMEEQIDTMERLVEVSSEEMRNLEVASRQLNDPAEQPLADTSQADVTEPAQAEAEASAESVAQPEPAPQPRQRADSGGLVDWLMDNLLWIVIALVAVVAAVLAAIFLRKRDSWEDDDFDGLEREYPGENAVDDPTLVAAPIDPTERAVAGGSTHDTLDQADALIAAGDYHAAAQLLESELDVEPGRDALRLKALEVYAAVGDHQRFDAHYAEALRRDDAALAERAELLRQGMVDAPPFNPGRYGLAAAGAGVAAGTHAGEFELSDDTLQFDLPPDDVLDVEPARATSVQIDSDMELEPELELESEAESEPLITIPAATPMAADDDFDLNFDDIDLQLEGGAVPADSLADLDAELGGFDFDDLGEPEPQASEEDVVLSEASTADLDLDFSDLEETAAAPAPVHGALFDDHNEFDSALELDLSPEPSLAGEDAGTLAENFLGEEDLLLELDEDESDSAHHFDPPVAGDLDEPMLTALDDEHSGTATYDFIESDLTGLEEVIPASDRLKPDAEDAPSVESVSTRPAPMPFDLPDVDPEADDDSQLGFLSDGDETATKLDLARAYLDMGDADGAKDILDEILEEGDQDQRREAQNLLAKLG